MAGKLPETMLKPEPVIEAEFTVRSEVPEDVSVTVLVVAVFTVTVPKERLPLIPNLGLAAAAPVPLLATVDVLPEVELLLMVNWPLTAPVVVGLNCTVNVMD